MARKFYQLQSSNIERISFDLDSRQLFVVFARTGKCYAYKGVPAAVILQLLWADSPGSVFHRSIRDVFPGAPVDEAPPSAKPLAKGGKVALGRTVTVQKRKVKS